MPGPKKKSLRGLAEEPARYTSPPEAEREIVEVGKAGRIVIPARLRERLGIKEGSRLILLLKDDALEVLTVEAGIRRAQEIVARFVPPEVSLVDELIKERREEQAKEDLA